MAKEFNLFEAQSTTGYEREAIYGALDTIGTLIIDNVLEGRMTPSDKRTHDFLMAVQGPAMEMQLRGLLIDQVERSKLLRRLNADIKKVEGQLARHPQIAPIWDHMMVNSGACMAPTRKDGKHKWPKGVPDSTEKKCLDCGQSRLIVRPFNPGSDDDVKHLLYDLLKMKKQFNKEHKVTADKEAREKLHDKYPKFADILALLTEHADLTKQRGFLKFRDDDGRFHSAFNVGVTSTHRFSSNKDAEGNGGNGQNITEKHRHIFVADPGMELCYADLKQAESKVISFVAGDEAYIEAHEGGDTHTFVCRLVWPEGVGGKSWTGDLKEDKVIASSARPVWDDREGHDFRYQSKAVQHGSNLGLTAFGMAIQKRIPVEQAADGQKRYFAAFPGIKGYQKMIREKVQNQEAITTPLGIRFKLFGRPWDEHTYKEGLAVIPQSMVGYIISIGLVRIWRQLHEIELLAQIHDAILFQFPKGRYDLVYDALKLMEVPIPVTGVDGKTRTLLIGTEAAVGHNWGHGSEHNKEGVHEITFASRSEWKIKS